MPVPTAPVPSKAPPPPLLGPDDPPPVSVLNPGSTVPVVLVCDHAGRAIPASLGRLGLAAADLDRHIAWDIGAAAVTHRLAGRFGAAAVLANYSRLVIDANRALHDPTAIPVISDEVVIPGNRAIDAHEQDRRVAALFTPYHDAIAALIAGHRAAGRVPALVSVHSFTPVMRGFARPWQVGVLWDYDPRIPVPLMERLRAGGRWCVGDNEPYSGRGTLGGTVETHAIPAGLPNVLIEIRQDLIADDAGAGEWAAVLGDALAPILADPALYTATLYPREQPA
ncbi:putative N-formylglutamate amidohydrolase [Azospirillum fermentarium]|uniref:N-formylglutamate amidohydrolase n=1 Tax=Azospirillum fermentarium TaxID=1233114 RepID=UPI0022280D15|nr:N-formylglutamate amidohydrolase [Azospirillum fermentarium]MCW2246995.1 putative N-formylglutamate amidohydrolase [Azospirillum fermentarium]